MKRWRLDAGPMRGGKAGFSQYCRVKRALLRGGSLHQASLSFLSPFSDTLSDNEVTYIINIVQEGVPHFCNAESIHLSSLLLLPPSWISGSATVLDLLFSRSAVQLRFFLFCSSISTKTWCASEISDLELHTII